MGGTSGVVCGEGTGGMVLVTVSDGVVKCQL